MAHLHLPPPALIMLLFALAFSGFELSTCQVVKGKVSCLDCPPHYDFSGTIVSVKCDKVKKLVTTTTKSEGSFEVDLPSGSTTTTSTPLNCLAKLMGGTTQIYATNKNMVSKVVKSDDASNSYTISTPLAFSTTSKKLHGIHESKTIDLPLPKEWGLAPSSYYVPFFPIIGIP
ncbi:Pollen Ole e 1 allergen and extensin family protein [Euphorbia peplus]|nr:Pollen Ole e 1 allergen and extensin family protein [Euphorbia peplus]